LASALADPTTIAVGVGAAAVGDVAIMVAIMAIATVITARQALDITVVDQATVITVADQATVITAAIAMAMPIPMLAIMPVIIAAGILADGIITTGPVHAIAAGFRQLERAGNHPALFISSQI